jgi:SOS-response transcriptional repressor LexA
LQEKQVGAKLARKIERSLKLPRGWMDLDHSGLDHGNTEPSDRDLRPVPEISWVQAGRFNGVEDFRPKYAEHPPVWTDRQVSRSAFALRVRGDSMMSPMGGGYPDGCRVIVDPAIEPRPGHRVIVRLDGVDEATFKELALDAGVYYLKPLNPRYPVMPMPEGARIVGVVVQTIIDE